MNTVSPQIGENNPHVEQLVKTSMKESYDQHDINIELMNKLLDAYGFIADLQKRVGKMESDLFPSPNY